MAAVAFRTGALEEVDTVGLLGLVVSTLTKTVVLDAVVSTFNDCFVEVEGLCVVKGFVLTVVGFVVLEVDLGVDVRRFVVDELAAVVVS